MQDFDDALSGKGGASRERLEEDSADGEQIAARVHVLAADDLLGRHIPRSADHHPASRQRGLSVEHPLGLGPRQAEVEQLDAVRCEEHVRGLEVAMDDPSRVQSRERREHVEADPDRLRDFERTVLQSLVQRFAVEQLHGDEQVALVLADLVDLADVGVVHAGGGAGLAPEAAPRRVVVAARDHLQRDRPFEPLVARRIDDAHAALAQLVRDRVVSDARGRVARGAARRVRGGRIRAGGTCQPLEQPPQPAARSILV